MPERESNKTMSPHAAHRGGAFRRDVVRLMSGTGIAQVVGIVAAPILSRIYAPDAFGAAALFASISGIVSTSASMAYEQGIVLPDEEAEAASLLGLSLLFCALTTILVLVFVMLVGGSEQSPLSRLGFPARMRFWVPVAVLMGSSVNILTFWHTRRRKFGLLSVAQVLSQLVSSGVALAFGISGSPSADALVGGAVAGQVAAAGALAMVAWVSRDAAGAGPVTWAGMRRSLQRYRRFPLYTTPSSLLNAASWQLPALLLGAFFSANVVGFYAVGFRILQIPMSLVGGAIRQVFLQRAAVERTRGELAPLVAALLRDLLTLAALPTLVLAVAGREAFQLLLGEAWGEAGVYAQILAPWALVWFVSSPLSSLYYVLEQQRKEVGMQVAIFLGRFLAIAAGGVLGGPRVAMVLLSVTGIATYGYLVTVILGFVRIQPRAMLTDCGPILVGSLVHAAPVLLAKHFGASPAVVIAVSAASMGLFFARQGRALSILRRGRDSLT